MPETMTKQKTDAMLAREHVTLRRLIAELRGICMEAPKTGIEDWLNRVLDCFEHFEAHYVKHMSLEERGGYLVPVLDEARPTLNKEVARLQAEHPQFVVMMESIKTQMRKLSVADSILVRDLCCRIAQLLSYIEQHEQEEDLLLIEGINREIGAKD